MRAIASAVLCMVLAAACTIAAFAHAKMTASIPEDGATVSAGLPGSHHADQ